MTNGPSSEAERRTSLRARTFLPARVSFDGGRASFETVVRDLSDDGARLKVSEGITLPETFRLHLLKTNECRQARLCWRRGDVAGVSFDRKAPQEPAPAPAAIVAAQRIRDLEAEVARLRGILGELRADPARVVRLLDQVS